MIFAAWKWAFSCEPARSDNCKSIINFRNVTFCTRDRITHKVVRYKLYKVYAINVRFSQPAGCWAKSKNRSPNVYFTRWATTIRQQKRQVAKGHTHWSCFETLSNTLQILKRRITNRRSPPSESTVSLRDAQRSFASYECPATRSAWRSESSNCIHNYLQLCAPACRAPIRQAALFRTIFDFPKPEIKLNLTILIHFEFVAGHCFV